MILSYFLISLISSIGLSILLVEKGQEWPLFLIVSPIRRLISFIYSKAGEVFDCTVCCSFWCALIIDLFMLYISSGSYFLWPITGFAASGISWFILEFLAILEK